MAMSICLSPEKRALTTAWTTGVTDVYSPVKKIHPPVKFMLEAGAYSWRPYTFDSVIALKVNSYPFPSALVDIWTIWRLSAAQEGKSSFLCYTQWYTHARDTSISHLFNQDTCVRVSFFAYRVFSPGRVSSTAWKLGKTCLWNDWHYCPLARWPFRMQRQLSWDIEWYEVGAMTVDGWAVTFGTAAQWGDWRGQSLSRPLLAVPNVTTHLLTAV